MISPQNIQFPVPLSLLSSRTTPFNLSIFETALNDRKPLLNPLQLAQSYQTQTLLNYQQKASFLKDRLNLLRLSHQNNILGKRNRESILEERFTQEIDGLEYLSKKIKQDKADQEVWSNERKNNNISHLDLKITKSPQELKTTKVLEKENPEDFYWKGNKKRLEDTNLISKVPQGEKAIEKALFEKEKQQLMFVVKKCHSKKKKDTEVLTRAEVLEKDPLLLIYFYEKSLKLVDATWFDPSSMKKLDK